ncbi:MAG: TonB family protein [Bryobacteraceae bacterium]|nr:TonB family protein [Bryobacteraceae bacterium]
MNPIILPLVLGFLPGLLSGQQHIEARLSSEPPLSPQEIAQLEDRVRANAADRDTRLRLLRQYMAFAPSGPGVRSPFQAARLSHVLYLIENVPEDPVSSGIQTYVPSRLGPFASASDHEAVRTAWHLAVDRLSGNPKVLLNAVRFLYPEHPEEAEQLLGRAVDRAPADRKIAANLGFLYALDILGLTSPAGNTAGRTESERERLREHAKSELELSRNMFVLAGAGTALPNLFHGSGQARNPDAAPPIFELASRLMSRARELGPQEAEFRGPLPLIREFQDFRQMESAQDAQVFRPSENAGALTQPGTTPQSPSSVIRVGGIVQAAKLMEKPEAVYPPEAVAARIQGNVQFNVLISQDGRVENATLRSGHPLLVPAATEAVRNYRYRPTLLNGVPVGVVSQVEVLFTMPK